MRKNLSSKFDRFLALPSQFDTNHRVDFYAHTYCQSATFVRPLFAFVLCFFTTKIKRIWHIATDAIVLLQLSYRCRHHRLLKTAHDYAQLSIMVDFIVLSIKLVFMVPGVSYSRVLAQRPTGCCSASNFLMELTLYLTCYDCRQQLRVRSRWLQDSGKLSHTHTFLYSVQLILLLIWIRCCNSRFRS